MMGRWRWDGLGTWERVLLYVSESFINPPQQQRIVLMPELVIFHCLFLLSDWFRKPACEVGGILVPKSSLLRCGAEA
jgi:hypothetical protein